MWLKLLYLSLAGAAGTVARYGIATLVQRLPGFTFPLGTLAVNALGCFAAGLLFTLFEQRWTADPQSKLIIMVGFMGAFTTFSAFIVETGDMVRLSDYTSALTNILLQNGLGIVALFSGLLIGRLAL